MKPPYFGEGMSKDYIISNQYTLLNKDVKICNFTLSLKESTPFTFFNIGEVTNIEYCDLYFKELYPNINSFIHSRQPVKHRTHIKDVLKSCSIFNMIGLIEYTHLTSLNDTYWVKSVNSALRWRDVSLYTNSFDEVIAKTAFEGGVYGRQFSTTTPELSTEGQFAKCWVRHDDKIFLRKLGSSGFYNSGLEPFSEYYAQQLLEALGINHTQYNLYRHKSRNNIQSEYYTECKLFTTEDVGFRPAYKYVNSLEDLYTLYKKYDCLEELYSMFISDALILNEDRHLGNFGFLVDNNTEEIISPAPCFDHNISLLCYATLTDLCNDNLNKYLNSKGHKLFSLDFITPVKSLITPSIRKALLNMQGFKFKPHSKYNLPKERLSILNEVVNSQIKLLLS